MTMKKWLFLLLFSLTVPIFAQDTVYEETTYEYDDTVIIESYFSADGEYIILWDMETIPAECFECVQRILVVSAATGELLYTLKYQDHPYVELHGQYMRILTGPNDAPEHIEIREIASGTIIHSFDFPTFQPGSDLIEFLVVMTSETMQTALRQSITPREGRLPLVTGYEVYDVPSGNKLYATQCEFPIEADFSALDYLRPTDEYAVLPCEDADPDNHLIILHVVDLQAQEVRYSLSVNESIYHVIWNTDSEFFALQTFLHEAVYNLTSPQPRFEFDFTQAIVFNTAETRMMTYSSEGGISVYDVETGNRLWNFSATVEMAYWSPDESRIAVLINDEAPTHRYVVLDAATGDMIASSIGEGIFNWSPPSIEVWSSDSRYIASCGEINHEGQLFVWDWAANQRFTLTGISHPEYHPDCTFGFSPDMRYLFFYSSIFPGNETNLLQVWDIQANELVFERELTSETISWHPRLSDLIYVDADTPALHILNFSSD